MENNYRKPNEKPGSFIHIFFRLTFDGVIFISVRNHNIVQIIYCRP